MDYQLKLLRQININEIDFNNPDFTKRLVQDLLNSLGNLYGKNVNLQRENQELKDLINNLKGEKGRPAIKPNRKEKECDEHSKQCCKGSLEKESIYKAGLKSTNYQHIDDTGFRVNGVNKYIDIVCNEKYSAFFIRDRKNHDTIEGILLDGENGIPQFDI